ncbi:hypothetical protein [Sulfitobacter dubius]|uniref:hypothetical protein n=1 Tax=Sulfitobacter dubius TaxID=218673 RepID=UPI0022AFAA24|nr:hypothetical protein [Sulfitobacter dubius]MCZ4367546.1 hypothetical protein [Sulfitobacter dubius]
MTLSFAIALCHRSFIKAKHLEDVALRLAPATKITVFSECEHGEFITVRGRGETHSGLCIRDEDTKPHLLILRSPDSELMYKLIQQEDSAVVLSFGTCWTLSPSGEYLRKHDATNKAGTFVQTGEGLFIVAHEMDSFADTVLCRIDQPGVSTDLLHTSSGFASPYWRIQYFDKTLLRLHELANNVPVSADNE